MRQNILVLTVVGILSLAHAQSAATIASAAEISLDAEIDQILKTNLELLNEVENDIFQAYEQSATATSSRVRTTYQEPSEESSTSTTDALLNLKSRSTYKPSTYKPSTYKPSTYKPSYTSSYTSSYNKPIYSYTYSPSYYTGNTYYTPISYTYSTYKPSYTYSSSYTYNPSYNYNANTYNYNANVNVNTYTYIPPQYNYMTGTYNSPVYINTTNITTENNISSSSSSSTSTGDFNFEDLMKQIESNQTALNTTTNETTPSNSSTDLSEADQNTTMNLTGSAEDFNNSVGDNNTSQMSSNFSYPYLQFATQLAQQINVIDKVEVSETTKKALIFCGVIAAFFVSVFALLKIRKLVRRNAGFKDYKEPLTNTCESGEKKQSKADKYQQYLDFIQNCNVHTETSTISYVQNTVVEDEIFAAKANQV
eukprot:403367632